MYEEIKKGVFYTYDDSPSIDSETINFLKEYCLKNKLKISRLCLHKNNEKELMSMLIVILDKYLYPIHKHSWKDESYTILAGEGFYEEYDKSGNMILKRKLKTYSSLLNDTRNFHLIRPNTNLFAFIETTIGPFTNRILEYMD